MEHGMHGDFTLVRAEFLIISFLHVVYANENYSISDINSTHRQTAMINSENDTRLLDVSQPLLGAAINSGNDTRYFDVFPPYIMDLHLNSFQEVLIKFTKTFIDQRDEYDKTYTLDISSEHLRIAVPLKQSDNVNIPYAEFLKENSSFGKISFDVCGDLDVIFVVKAIHIGRTKMLINLAETDYQNDSYSSEPVKKIQDLTKLECSVTVIRRRRLVDNAFEIVVAGIAMLNIFSIGCSLDVSQAKQHVHQPTAILMGGLCQFFLTPVVAFGLAKLLQLEDNLGIALLYVACTPGGGLGHLMTVIIEGDLSLSLAMNFVNTILVTGTGPLWIFGLGYFFNIPTSAKLPLQSLEIWLVSSMGIFLLGMLLRYIKLSYAEAVLNWLSKPMLLLYSILFLTLGMYINLYMFEQIQTNVLVATGLLPSLGFIQGGIIAILSRQNREFIKTISTESASLNCMLVLVILRFSLPQPDADIASTIPIWIMFMTPLPFIVILILRHLRSSVIEMCSKRREKYRTFSVASSLLNVTNITSLSNTTTPMVSPTQEDVMFIDEKITVL